MYLIFYILIIVVCVFLALIVLVQNSKGGGLTANFSSQQQMMGVRKTTDFLEKATWTLATALLVLSIFASLSIKRPEEGVERSKVDEQVNTSMDVSNLPDFSETVEEETSEEPLFESEESGSSEEE